LYRPESIKNESSTQQRGVKGGEKGILNLTQGRSQQYSQGEADRGKIIKEKRLYVSGNATSTKDCDEGVGKEKKKEFLERAGKGRSGPRLLRDGWMKNEWSSGEKRDRIGMWDLRGGISK